MTNGNRKGKVGERELAAFLCQLGVAARRGQQRAGGADSPDIVHDLDGLHLECKRTEVLRLREAIEQAAAECGGKVPVVCWRSNRMPWVAILPLEELVRLVRKREGRPA